VDHDTRYDVLLIHPPYLLHDEGYPIFPLPWSLGHVGSTTYIGKYPVGPAWTYYPLGFNTMREFVRMNSDFSIEIKNLSVLKYLVPQPIMAKYGDALH
jgi:hypothetical protein